MSRLKQARALLAAADQWKQRCLLAGGSLFTDERLWTPENCEQLRVHYVETMEKAARESGDFYEKLRRQLDPVSPEAKRLWAEMTWALFLITIHKPTTKKNLIRMVWEWSSSPFPEDHPALRDDVLTGCANAGAGYNIHRWREMGFFVSAMTDWFSASRRERGDLLEKPWAFADWLAGRRFVQKRQFPHALLFLLFPDSFEPIVVGSRKRKIVEGFAQRWGEAPPSDGAEVALDRRLLEIRKRLEAKYPEKEIDFVTYAGGGVQSVVSVDGVKDADTVGKEQRSELPSDRGIEEESEDPESGAVEHPFDPAKIKVRTIPTLVGQLLSRMEHDEIDLAPDFQRKSGIWNAEKKSRLIESLLLRIPIPVFYVAADADEKWAVVDGVQRLSTIRDYVKGEFPLTRLEYRSEFDGLRHGDLPRPMQRRIDETQFVVNVIEPGTPPEVTFNIFSRINTGGMPLKGQEIRHALNPGPVRDYLKALAESDEFVKATAGSISPNRMDDRACVLRFLAFHMAPWEEYSGSSLDGHLDAAMKKINAMGQDRRNALAADFGKAMRAASRIFGDDAFRKRYVRSDSRRQVSMPLFEAWSVQLARCPQERIDRLVERRDEVRERFMSLLNQDPEFEKAISASTGTPRRIRKRFAAIRDLVQELV